MVTREPMLTHAVPAQSEKVKSVVGLVIAICVALLLGSAGVLKVAGFQKFVDSYIKAGQPYWVLYGSGVIEIIASIALLFSRTRRYAAWTLLTMIFLVAWKPWSVHDKSFLLPQCFAISMLIVLVWPLRPAQRLER
jgi:uncharacterized membrane protein YphA (DoxX/SURF4 family)